MTAALDVLSALVIEDGRRWGAAATPAQLDDARAILSAGPDEPRRHLLLRARGFAKTQDAAALTLSVMVAGELAPGSEIYCAAADRDQAGLVLRKIRGLVERTAEIRPLVEIGTSRVSVPSRGVALDVLSSDSSSSWGLTPSWLVVDELCWWPESSNARQFFTALLSALPKRADSRAVLISTPSTPSHWSFADYERALKDSRWRVSHVRGPAPWMSSEELAAERSRLPESMYARLFECEWAAADDQLASLDDVRACVRAVGELEPQAGVSYSIGVDLSVTTDYTVAAVVHAERDQGQRRLIVDRLVVWKPSRRHPIDMGVVESTVTELARAYGASVVADKYQAIGLVQRLRANGVNARGEDMTSSSNNRRAVQLYRALRDGAIELPAGDEELVAELASLSLREGMPGVYRLASSGKGGGGHHDRSTAISLAAEVVLVERGGRLRYYGPATLPAGPMVVHGVPAYGVTADAFPVSAPTEAPQTDEQKGSTMKNQDLGRLEWPPRPADPPPGSVIATARMLNRHTGQLVAAAGDPIDPAVLKNAVPESEFVDGPPAA